MARLIENGYISVAVTAKLPSVRKVLVVDYLGTSSDVAAIIDKAVALEEALSPFAVKPVTFERLPFAHPLDILFVLATTPSTHRPFRPAVR